MQEIVRALEAKREAARQGGGAARIEAQHAKGRLTARERHGVRLSDDAGLPPTGLGGRPHRPGPAALLHVVRQGADEGRAPALLL